MLDLFNKALNPLSMYKGIAMGLTFVWFVAVVFSFIGWLDYLPLAMLASLGVFGVVTVGASVLFGWLFGVRPHVDSSIITALILALIFTPTLDAGGLMVQALVALIAAASKFVLVWKGRHIFNPAAIAAVIVAFTGLGAASWWVATPALTPFVLILALISLYKTRRLLVAGVFVAISVPLVIGYLLTNGVDFMSAIAVLPAWPILFFAGVMLTEPLTLPPRKWQQYLEAAIVAVLFAIPFDLGLFSMTPALALVAGNLIAFGFARREHIALTFKQLRPLTPTTDEIVFTPAKPVHFEPGQYMELSIPHSKKDLRGSRRSFSMTSVPGADEVTFGVKFYEPSSSFKKALRSLKEGANISATMTGGDFVLPKDAKTPLALVAGGIGITPFISHLKSLKETRDIVLIYAVNTNEEIAYRDVLAKAGITVVIASADDVVLESGWSQIKEARLSQDAIASAVPEIEKRTVYISGPPPLVDSVKRSARKLGAKTIHTDYFVGY